MPAPTSAAPCSTVATSSRVYGRPGVSRLTDTRPTTSPFAWAGATIMLWNPASSKYCIASASTLVRMQSCGTIGFNTVVPAATELRTRLSRTSRCMAPIVAATVDRRRGSGCRTTAGRNESRSRPSSRATARSPIDVASASVTSSMTVSALTAAASRAAWAAANGRSSSASDDGGLRAHRRTAHCPSFGQVALDGGFGDLVAGTNTYGREAAGPDELVRGLVVHAQVLSGLLEVHELLLGSVRSHGAGIEEEATDKDGETCNDVFASCS